MSTGVTSSGSGPALDLSVTLAGLLDGNSTGWEQARDVALDDQGNIYIVGGTSSADFPVTAGAYDTTYNTGGSELGGQGQSDVFVTKLGPTGVRLWSTYLGSPNYDRGYAVEVDAAHNVYVAGRAGRGFPTTPGVLQPAFAGDSIPSGSYGSQDGFVAKLSADGSTLLWSTYFGESGSGFVRDLDVDAQGRVHVAASTVSGSDMNARVTAGAIQATRRGNFDTFYARLSADGTSVEYGTYLGGNDTGGAYSSNPAVRVLPDGTAYVLTIEPGSGAPTTAGAFQTANSGGDDLLLARFNTDGTLGFCTYVGSSANDNMDTHSLALDPSGNPVVGAATMSADFPVTTSATWQGGRDLTVSVFSPTGALLRSTLVGGSGPDGAEGIAVDAAGRIYVTGFTNSANLPVTTNALFPTHAPTLEGLMVVLAPDLSPLMVSYDGVTAEYGNRSCTVSPSGTWAIVGAVWQLNPFPATAGQDAQIQGQHGAFFRVLTPL